MYRWKLNFLELEIQDVLQKLAKCKNDSQYRRLYAELRKLEDLRCNYQIAQIKRNFAKSTKKELY